jgi:hypothetical protein
LPRKPCPYDIVRFSSQLVPTPARILITSRSTLPLGKASAQKVRQFTRILN